METFYKNPLLLIGRPRKIPLFSHTLIQQYIETNTNQFQFQSFDLNMIRPTAIDEFFYFCLDSFFVFFFIAIWYDIDDVFQTNQSDYKVFIFVSFWHMYYFRFYRFWKSFEWCDFFYRKVHLVRDIKYLQGFFDIVEGFRIFFSLTYASIMCT